MSMYREEGPFYGDLEYNQKYECWQLLNLQPHVAIRLKQIFPKIAKSETKRFRIEDTPLAAADLEWFISRYALRGDEQTFSRLALRAQNFFDTQAKATQILLPDWKPNKLAGLMPGQSLRDYQLQAIALAEVVRSLVLVDDIGLGKTYEALGLGLAEGALPMVVVMEPHNQDQWAEKAAEFVDLRVHKVKGNKPYDLPRADIYLFKYTQLSPWVDVLGAGWINAIVFDEIQQLRTGTDSAKGAAANEICRDIEQRNGFLIGLTATPIYNYGIEAFNIVSMIRPNLLGSRDEFLREWCSGTDARGVVSDPESLGSHLREQMVFLRRTKKDVGQEAKQERPHVEWVAHEESAVQEEINLAESLAVRALSGDFNEAGQASREFDIRMRQMTGIAKAKETAAFVRMFLEAGTPVILFGWHREVYRIWEKELAEFNPLFYTGSETAAQKQKNKKAFIAGESNLFIMSLRSGAGTDGLQHVCSTAIFGEFDWSPKIHEQCIGRLDRDGQLYSVFAFYVATNFGSDPEILDILGLKDSQSSGIVDLGKNTKDYQASTNRIKQMAERYLKVRGIDTKALGKEDDEENKNKGLEPKIALI